MRRLLTGLLVAGLAAVSVVALASASRSSGNQAKVAPSAETANAYLMPGDQPCQNEWIYYGWDIGGDSFSKLTQINKGNVANLKVAWDKGYSVGTYSGPVMTQPICCPNGQMYVASANTTEAVKPDTGDILWKYQGPKFDTTSSGPNATTMQIIARGIAYDTKDNLLFTCPQAT